MSQIRTRSIHSNPVMNYWGSIVDILSGAESKRIAYANPIVKDLVYEFGSDSIMRETRSDLSQRSLDLLKKVLKEDYRPPSSSFGIHKQTFPDPVNSTASYYEKPYNEETSSGKPHEFDLRWIHLPVNEVRPSDSADESLTVTSDESKLYGDSHFSQTSDKKFKDLVSRLSRDSKRSEGEHMTIMKHFNKSWTELAAGSERYYMKPQFVNTHHNHPISGVDGDQTPKEVNTDDCAAIYMPYLDTGTYPPTVNKPPTTEHLTMLDESINERNSRTIKHLPMTLDQYYYPAIEDTSKRDNDQVLSKFLQKKFGQSKTLDLDYRQKYCYRFRIATCDSADSASETIITATTQNFGEASTEISKADREPPESLQNAVDNILYGETKSQFERARTADSLMELLLGVASGLFIKRFVPVSDQIYKGPIEIFRESIRDMAEKESSLFQEFLQGLQEANPREPEQKQGKPSNTKSDTKSPDGPMPLNRYHVISSETELLNMIRDICDELHMLRSLAEDQEIVWKQAFASSDLMHFKAYTPTNVKKDLDDMLSEADETESYINTLLDRRQAEFGRLQAYDSARQSNSIFIFTTMTIVFGTMCNIRGGGYFLLSAIGVTTLVSVPATIFTWKFNAISSFRPRNSIVSESLKHTDALKVALSRVRRRGRKQHDIEAK
ncbi:putative ankyrin repeat protein [Botrytis fragariae]|uniref:Putative ankyrin repeat protein n=1 Tax=Botrytis fragariae TaxID=1964551 RepID=A0A8H6AZT6_9HELO|nr:putative ankyrin repeat protein [Botrytis fragariae]KAF5876598.1 putative ankyrin repeat protein [Botrytis fragariae]